MIDTTIIRKMNRKIFVGVAVAIFAVIIGAIAFSGQLVISDVTEGQFLSNPSSESHQVLPISIELEELSVLELTDKAATLKIKFKVSNPNFKSVILQFLKYDIYNDNIRIHTGSIGDRPEGFVMGSNYFIILNERPTILSDKITIKNEGNNPEFWSALADNNPKWKITGEAFFNLSSMTAGGENQITFEFII